MFSVQANTLKDPKSNILERIDAMAFLMVDGSVEAIDALIKGFKKEKKSDLLRHEICYCLGQMGKS
jgi:deoxyhypusine monooxygenase